MKPCVSLLLFFLTPNLGWILPERKRVRRNIRLMQELSATACDNAANELKVAGVSVSPTGFWVFFQHVDAYYPVKITSEDTNKVKSPQALTILQLLAGVDMASYVAPELLSKLVVLHCEQEGIDLSLRLPDGTTSYSELHPWMQARVSLPSCALKRVLLDDHLTMECHVDDKTLSIVPSAAILNHLSYPSDHANFVALALALRYKTPIVLNSSPALTRQELLERFPLQRPANQLLQSSQRIASNIEKSFRIHQLQAALRIARERDDPVAAAKIRTQLDVLDSMTDLPTQPESDIENMQ